MYQLKCHNKSCNFHNIWFSTRVNVCSCTTHRQNKYTLIRQLLRSCLVWVYLFSKRRLNSSPGLNGLMNHRVWSGSGQECTSVTFYDTLGLDFTILHPATGLTYLNSPLMRVEDDLGEYRKVVLLTHSALESRRKL